MLSISVLLTASCSDTCTANFPADCAPEYEATFANVYARTLSQSCAIPGGSCHAAAGKAGGLDLEGEETAYNALVTDGRVVAGDTTCGDFGTRITTTGSGRMPPGFTLREGELCAIRDWIAAGAKR